ncbi:hypothetical protein ACWDBW_30305 [Streptomyces sp. NPDC001107]
MCEVDGRRIKEAAKLAPHVVRGAGGAAPREEARKVMKLLALMPESGRDPHAVEDLE